MPHARARYGYSITSCNGPEVEAIAPEDVFVEEREEDAPLPDGVLGHYTRAVSCAIYTPERQDERLFQRVQYAGVTLADEDFLRLQIENTYNVSTGVVVPDRVPENIRKAQERARPMIKAERLLSRMLNSQQRATWERFDYFEVRSKMNPRVTYQIPRHGTIQMTTLSRLGHKTKVKRLCIHPREYLPDGDRVLALKLLTEHQEHELLSTANIFN